MQPHTPFSPTPQLKKSSKKIVIISLIVGLIVIAGIVVTLFLLLKPSNNVQQNATNPTKTAPTVAFTVNSHPYLYACSAIAEEDIKKVVSPLTTKPDYSVYSGADGLLGGRGNILDLTKQIYTNSVCAYGFDASQQEHSETATVYLTQFTDNATANKELKSSRPTDAKDIKELASTGDSYYSITQQEKSQIISGSVIKDNFEIFIQITLTKAINEETAKSTITSLLQSGLKKITSKVAMKPVASNNKLCNQIAAANIQNDLGITIKPVKNVSETYSTPATRPGYSIKRTSSRCAVNFQTPADKKAASATDLADDELQQDRIAKTAYDKQFPHRLSIEVSNFASIEDAKKDFDELEAILRSPATNGGSRPQIVPTEIGDKAFFSSTLYHDTNINTIIYYVLKGKQLYIIVVDGSKQQEPYASDGYILSEKAAKGIINKLSQNN